MNEYREQRARIYLQKQLPNNQCTVQDDNPHPKYAKWRRNAYHRGALYGIQTLSIASYQMDGYCVVRVRNKDFSLTKTRPSDTTGSPKSFN